MRGNQSLELATSDRILSYALGRHFNEDNCCGALMTYATPINANQLYSPAIYQFVCWKCFMVIEINEKTN